MLQTPKGVTTTTKLGYYPVELVKAWNLLLSSSDELKNSDGYQFDVTDLTRQVLANYASVIQQQFAKDYKQKDLDAFKLNSKQFIDLLNDMDYLLASRKDFLLGLWLEAAKKWGTNPQEASLYEKNARNLITLWGDKNSRLHEYACKQWSGMMVGFYKPRWQQFYNDVSKSLVRKESFNAKKFEEGIKDWEWQWVNGSEKYSTEAKGNSVKIAKQLFNKYHQKIVLQTEESISTKKDGIENNENK